ncbi:MAG: ParB/RepB/Spo0J family partition protein [Armatimonadota bacterium]|nr:ParB/RepB/Spo0J family partition protein [Armatimonadota bacterium]MDR5702027.1 ParB/RepB/Spo0J family partition protein [Armatimonadota bacterium]MDR7434675.1 ParB/RepB/Spo0J family partition protein [Armatimonadota bacterium]
MPVSSHESPDRGGRKKGGLGKGLAALFPGIELREEAVQEIPIELISPGPFQPRSETPGEDFQQLVASVKEHGILQPILVRPREEGYEIVAGERRWRAAAAAGLPTIPAVVRPLGDREAMEVALVENLQRLDLSPLERARAYDRLIKEFQMTQEEIARRIGLSRSAVANTLRLLQLPKEIQSSLEAGELTEGHARAILTLGDTTRMLEVWGEVKKRGLSVRETESLVRRVQSVSRETKAKTQLRRDPQLTLLEEELRAYLGTQVRIIQRRKKGAILIEFYSSSDLDRITGRILKGEGG